MGYFVAENMIQFFTLFFLTGVAFFVLGIGGWAIVSLIDEFHNWLWGD